MVDHRSLPSDMSLADLWRHDIDRLGGHAAMNKLLAQLPLLESHAAVVAGPSAPVLGSVIRVTGFTQYGEQAGLNTGHWVCVNVRGQGQPYAQTVKNFAQDFILRYKPGSSTLTDVLGVELAEISPSQSVTYSDFTFNAKGTVTGKILPRQCAGLGRRISQAAGRAGHGRLYFPFPPASFTVDNIQWETPALAQFSTMLQFWTRPFHDGINQGDGSNVNEWNAVLYHRAAKTFTGIVQEDVSKYIATQRRRGDFGRPNVAPQP